MDFEIKKFLKSLPEETIYFKPNPGNGGDALIAYATIKLLNDLKIDYKLATNDIDLEDKILLYGGGGNLVGYYSTAHTYLSTMYSRLKQLIILPHTIYDNDKLLETFGKNVTIICRELRSHEYVSSFNNLGSVLIMDDLALSINPNDLLNGYRGSNDEKMILLKHRFKRITKLMSFGVDPFNVFRYDKEESHIHKPIINTDLSNALLYDPTMLDPELVTKNTQAIFKTLSNFKTVNTNRLHISIAAALLGKTVNLYSNSYWKIEEVFRYSLKKKFPNIIWKGEAEIV